MANITLLTLDDPVDGSLTTINGNFTAINTELGSHTHDASAITSGVFSADRLASGTPTTTSFLRGDSVWAPVTWGDVSGKPTTFTPSAHNHSASEITAGVLAAARLGSGTASASTFLRGNQQWSSIFLSDINETSGYFYRSGGALVWQNPPNTYTSWIASTLILEGFSGSDVPVGGGQIITSSSRGTPANPLPLKANDSLFGVVYQGRRPNGNAMEGGRITFYTPADWTDTSTPADLVIALNAPGESSNFNNKFWFKGTGRLGIKTSNPAYELDVNGTARATTLLGTNIGIGTAIPLHPLHANASADSQGFRLDRDGSARALIIQDSSGGVIQLFDSSQVMKLYLGGGYYSKIPIRLGINLPDSSWPEYHLHVYEQSVSATSVWVENSYGAAGSLAQVRCLAWSGTGAPSGGFFVGHGSRGTKASPSPTQSGDRLAAFIGTGQQDTTPGTGAMISFEAASNWSDSNRYSHMRFLANGPGQYSFPPPERLRIEGEGDIVLQPALQTPSNPSTSSEVKIYVRSNKLIFQYNDAGTVRYKYLDMTGTGVTWVHTTTAP